MAWNAVGMLAIVKVLDVSEAGRASGLVLLGFYAGYVIGPVGFGFSVDLLGTYAIGWAFVTICYVVSLLTSGMWYVQQRQGSRPRERLV